MGTGKYAWYEQFHLVCNINKRDQEAAEGTIELPDDDLPIVEAMLNFLYHFDYQASTSPMIFNAKVYGIADKYNIPTLKSKAIEKSRKSVETCWSMDDFPHAIREIYSSTPGNDRGLRDLVVKIACEHMETLSEQPEFRILLEEAYGFAADVVLFMARGSFERIKTHKCPNCGKTWEGVAPSGPNYYCLRCGSYRSDWEAHVVHR